MRCPSARVAVASLILAVAIGAPAVAGAKAAPTVPAGFFGVAVHEPTWEAKDPAGEFRQMRIDGVESVSAAVYWNEIQPYADAAAVPEDRAGEFTIIDGVPTSFAVSDRLYEHAARRGMTVLPVIVGVPPRERVDPDATWSPPADPEAYGRFVGLLVKRYGAGGTFWASHPKLPRVPTRDWQIWNEPTGWAGPLTPSVFWDGPKPYQERYVAMLRAAHTAIHAQDPRGRALLGGILGVSWDTIEDLYAQGAGPYFDGAAIHVYTQHAENVINSLKYARAVMDEHGDRAKPLVLTEFGWPSALDKVVRQNRYGFETNEGGQAYRLQQAFEMLVKNRVALRLTQVFWFAWATFDTGNQYVFDYAGLRAVRPSGKVVPKMAEARYRTYARRYEGCQRKVRPARCRI